MTKKTQLLQFPGLPGPVRLDDAYPVGKGLRAVLNGWSPSDLTGAKGAPVSAVSHEAGGYRVDSPYLDEPLERLPLASAVCGVLADMSEAFFEGRRGAATLHCGAFETGGRLIALTGHAHAGKSTLMARLSAEPDLVIYCDDILPLGEDGSGIALGAAPRLRLPLPKAASAAFCDHVARHAGPSDDEYCYVCAPNIAAHGRSAPLSVLIVLDRRQEGQAALHQLGRHEAIHHLLTQNMTDFASAEDGFEKANALAANLLTLRLVYSDLEDAAALLRRAFVGHARINPAVSIGKPLPPLEPEGEAAPPADPDTSFKRAPNTALRAHGEAAFLWRKRGQTLFQLNAVGAAIWALLEIPGSAHDLVLVLAEAFPDVNYDQLTRDCCALLGELHADGLIRPA
ncbi:MAG: PqqD family protein [Paracoccus sp. (in: a-proteobacteria)]|nr:PqqD family protein [Paracoccus sp. (in: a-proteobacteria)]